MVLATIFRLISTHVATFSAKLIDLACHCLLSEWTSGLHRSGTRAFEEGVALSTVYEYKKRPRHGGGRPTKMSPEVLCMLKEFICKEGSSTRAEQIEFLLAKTGKLFNVTNISRATKKLGFKLRYTTKKKIGSENENLMVVAPDNRHFNSRDMLDMDEMGGDMKSTCRRQ
ncbi:hypothetical protein Pelo_12091 [Pelomyxa schiedti]|nr:hypothetical protein Pelo_12091 [Pelomyxa schiedti]